MEKERKMRKAWSLTAELKKQRESLLEDWIEADRECRKYEPHSGEYWEEYRQLKSKCSTEEDEKSLKDMERRLEEEGEKACQRKRELEGRLKEMNDQLSILGVQ